MIALMIARGRVGFGSDTAMVRGSTVPARFGLESVKYLVYDKLENLIEKILIKGTVKEK